MWTKNFQMYKLISRRQRNQKSNHQQFIGSWRKQGSSRKTSTYASLIILKSLTVWITTNCGKFLEIEIPNHLPCLLRNLFAGQEATVRTRTTERNKKLVQNWERSTSRLYIVNPAYLTYMQSESCKMLGWMKLKLDLRLSGGISTMSDVQMIQL